MTVLVEGTIKCNGECKYCYNTPMRNASNECELDLAKMKEAMRKLSDQSFTLHGGEPLVLEREVLDALLGEMYAIKGESNIQTNGTLIGPEHVEMFKKYKTHVGFSLDGFGELNRFRFSDPEKVWSTLLDLKLEGISVGLLSVISKANGLPEQREAFKEFALMAHREGFQPRLLPCRHSDLNIQLSTAEALDFYTDMLDFVMVHGIYGWSPFSDILHALKNEWDKVWCRFHGCDPFNTTGGIVVTRNGSLSNCHKFADVQYKYMGERSDLRANILQQTDCKGCGWFGFCRGGCPGDALDFDWRRKTTWCPVWKMLFERIDGIKKFSGI